MLIWQWDGAYLVLCISIIYISILNCCILWSYCLSSAAEWWRNISCSLVCASLKMIFATFAACFFLFFACASCWSIVSLSVIRISVCRKQASKPKAVYFWEKFWHKAFVWFSNYMPFLVVWNSVLAAETQIQSQNQFWWCMLTPQQPNIHASAGSQ